MKRLHLRGGALPLAALAVAGLATTIALPATLQAQAPDRGGATNFVSATVYPGGVDFTPEVRYREAIVTVAGNGRNFSYAIKPDERLSIGVFDPEGQLLPDGVYKWSLALVPTARAADQLKATAAQNGGRAPRAWGRASGTFAIQGGVLLSPDAVEPKPARRAPAPAVGAPSSPLGSSSAPRAASADDDAAVSLSRDLETAMSVSSRSTPQAAAAGPPATEGPGFERSDSATLAMGGTLERRPASDAPATQQLPDAPVGRSMVDDPENGRDRSNQQR